MLGAGRPAVALEPSQAAPTPRLPAAAALDLAAMSPAVSLPAGRFQEDVRNRPSATSALAPPARDLPVPFVAAALPPLWARAGEGRAPLAPEEAGIPVTIMMKNIPSRCRLTHVLDAVEASGFRNTFEFLYLPTKPPRHSQNRGYAFVSFLDFEQARVFCAAMSGVRFDRASPKEVMLEEAREYRSLGDVRAVTKTQVQFTKFGPVLAVAQEGDGRRRESDPNSLDDDDELPHGTRLSF